MPKPSRRDFIRLATTGVLSAAGLIGLGGLIRFLDFQGEQPPDTTFDLGEPGKYPPGTRTMLPDVPAILISTDKGFTALSLVCTHLGCTVEQTPGGFQCPCHGSRYSADGEVQQGPARLALHKLRLETAANGHLLLHSG